MLPHLIADRAEQLRGAVVDRTLELFSQADDPMAHTMEHPGDAGLFGPGSVTWELMSDASTFIGGIRALLIQAAHPEVVAGVSDHSRYRDDPLGRLSRTSAYVTATTFGAMPEVNQAIAQVERIHRVVKGVSRRGVPYSADDPAFSAWVHNVLTDSFLTTHLAYGGIPLTGDEPDRFIAEQTRIGALLGADPMPTGRDDLYSWVERHPALATSPEMKEAVAFLIDPPLPITMKIGYRVLLEAAIPTIPRRIRDILGVYPAFGATTVGRSAVAGLRWALGYSPSWRLALERCGEDVPEHLFKEKPRVA